MKLKSLSLSIVLSSAVLLTGCSQAAETTIESAVGSDVDIDGGDITITGEDGESLTLDSDDNSATYTDEESGVTINTGSDVELPAGVPSGFPLPASGSLVSASESSSDNLVILQWSWENMTEEDFESYRATLVNAGYVEESVDLEQSIGGQGFMKGVTLASSSHTVSVLGQVVDGMGGLTISISPVE